MPPQMGPGSAGRRLPSVAGQLDQHARPPREGLPPFPSGPAAGPPPIFRRVPPGMGDRPIPTPPDIPSPGVVLRTGERVNRSSVLDPVNVFAYGGVGLVVYLVAKKAKAQGADTTSPQTPPAPAIGVDPELARQQFERDRRALASEGRMTPGTELPFLAEQIDEFLFGKEKAFALQRLLGLVGQGGKVQVEAVKRILAGSAAGAGEEDQIARMNEAIKSERQRVAEFLFGLLRLTPPLAGGPGGVVAPPQEQADP